MARKSPSVTDQLADLRQKVSTERVRHAEVQIAVEGAKADLQRATEAITAAYVTDDASAVSEARKAQAEAVAEVDDLAHQLDAADLRLQRARNAVSGFMGEHGRTLIAEREADARHAAEHLSDCVRAMLGAFRRYRDFRVEMDGMVSAIPGAVTRVDGCPSTFAWERELQALDRAAREYPEPPMPPMPRWNGLQHQEAQNAAAMHLRDQRRQKVA